MTIKKLHFKNKEAFRKFLAFEHIHHLEKKQKTTKYPRVIIAGRPHRVKHK